MHPQLKIYKRICSYLSPYRLQFFGAIFCMVLFGASDGAIPFVVKHILDEVFTDHNVTLLYLLPVFLIAFSFLRAIIDFGQSFLMAKIGHFIMKDIRNALNAHLLQLSSSFFIKNSTADLLSRITSDVLLVRTLLTSSMSALMRDSIRVIALLIAAIYLDPLLALIAFVVFPIGFFPIYRFGKKMRSLSKKGQDAIGALSTLLQESILGNKVVKIFGRENFERERFEEENIKLTQTFVRTERIRSLTGPINEILASVAISGVLVYGGYSVIGGVRSQGDFIAFLLAVFLLYDPFKKLSRVNNEVQQGIAGAERIFEVLDAPADILDPESPVPLPAQNAIAFRGVNFAYDLGKELVLKNINIEIPEGAKIALVGFSGAGKTTLIDLIPRFLDPISGCIEIEGVNIAKVSLKELRSRMALVGQHTFLFNDTIYNNICYGSERAGNQDVISSAKAAYAHEFIMRLPQQYETEVGEGGFSLSGGERQRIAIARAILKNAPILILDEATASLDNKSEREVQAALEELEKNRTSIIIAHRLSTIQNADKIFVVSKGEIVEQGTHQELLKRGGEYSKLYELQFSERGGGVALLKVT